MGRLPLKPGTHGEVSVKEKTPGKWIALARFGDLDGITRTVERSGPTEKAALAALDEAFKERRGGASADAKLTSTSRVRDAAALYLERTDIRRKGTTYDTYRRWVTNEIVPSIGGLRGVYCTVARLQSYMDKLETADRLSTGEPLSPNSRRQIRKCIRGIMQMFVRHGVLDRNPVNDLDVIEGGPKKRPRSYDAAETREFLRRVDNDKVAMRTLLNVVVRFLFYVGCRIGEALAVRWADLNLTAKPVKVIDPVLGEQVIPPYSVWVNGNVVRVTGKGLIREDGKTESSRGVVGLPPTLVTLLLFITPADADPYEPVFPATSGGWRCPNNVQTSIRRLRKRISELDAAGSSMSMSFVDFTTHIGRKSYGTALDEGGQSARKIADALRKASVSDTQNTYMGRRIVNAEAAALVESYFMRDIA